MNTKQLTYFLTGLSMLVLVGCQSHNANKSEETAAQEAMSAGPGGAQTFADQVDNQYSIDQAGFRVNAQKAPANQTYYFSFDQTAMRPEDLLALRVQGRYLLEHPSVHIRLEGNTDERGSREYNIGLGWRRDQTVQRQLEQMGVSPSQIQMISYGKERPAVSGDSEHAWSLNRRVDFIYKVNS
jgi:peptidoglycan-associated lipoprotein